MDTCWVIDSGITSYCTDNISIFEHLTTQTGKLTTTDRALRIVGREDAIISLLNSSIAKLAGILMVPGIGINLLSTQALLAQGIENY